MPWVSGWDPHTEAEKFTPYMPVRNVTSEYPPTILIHGTDGTDVPYQQSLLMAEQFRRHGVEHGVTPLTQGSETPGLKYGIPSGFTSFLRSGRAADGLVHRSQLALPLPLLVQVLLISRSCL